MRLCPCVAKVLLPHHKVDAFGDSICCGKGKRVFVEDSNIYYELADDWIGVWHFPDYRNVRNVVRSVLSNFFRRDKNVAGRQ